jgi:membrane associated rhomboid family serine protease
MGIYDRHYYRDRPSEHPARGALQRWRAKDVLRMWSVNTWLIVLCIAVFIIDGFTPTRSVPMSDPHLFDGVTQLPQTAVRAGRIEDRVLIFTGPNGQTRQELLRVQPLFERPGGTQIGWIEVTEMRLITSWLFFSTTLGFLRFEFWRFIGFQFLHANEYHLLFNMIGLFYFGPLVEEQLGSKRYLAFYLLCGIFGALMYLLLNLTGYVCTQLFGEEVTIPGLLFNDPHTPLVGASAGIFGVLMAGAYLYPNAIALFFFIPMRLRTLAYGLVALALFTIIRGGHNAGGEAGHLGGAIGGFYFIRHPHHLHNFFDILGRVDPTSRHYRLGSSQRGPASPLVNAAEVDRILAKISTQGMHSLTDEERTILRENTRQRGG